MIKKKEIIRYKVTYKSTNDEERIKKVTEKVQKYITAELKKQGDMIDIKYQMWYNYIRIIVPRCNRRRLKYEQRRYICKTFR